MSDKNLVERALDWGDEISYESEYQPLPPGEYEFVVIKFERGEFKGSDKMPPCKRADLELQIEHEGRKHTVKTSLLLHTKVEGILSAFFTAIGQKKKGAPLSMNWGKVPGARGRCKTKIRKGKEDQEFTEIARWLPPSETPQTGFTPGAF